MGTVSGRGIANVICDVCGFQYKTNELFKRWDGAMVCKTDFEVRHPQEFIRPVRDNFPLPYTRKEVDDVYTYLMLTVTMAGGGGDEYYHHNINNDAYVITAGDILKYDYLVDPVSPTPTAAAGPGGFDIRFSDATYLRSLGAVDQYNNNVTAPKSRIPGTWHYREIQLGGAVGKTTTRCNLVQESNTGGTYIVKYRNIRIENQRGVVRFRIWMEDDALDTDSADISSGASNASVTRGIS